MSDTALKQGKPFLGICVGMQLMASEGVEFGTHKGLDWIKGKVVVLDPADRSLRIPQMGWNNLQFKSQHAALAVFGPRPVRYSYLVFALGLVTTDLAWFHIVWSAAITALLVGTYWLGAN